MKRDEVLSRLYQLSVAEYQIYEDPKIEDGVCLNLDDEKMHSEIGLLAQQLELLFPHVIKYVNGENDLDGIKVMYPMLIPILVLAIQEQRKEIMDLKSKLDTGILS